MANIQSLDIKRSHSSWNIVVSATSTARADHEFRHGTIFSYLIAQWQATAAMKFLASFSLQRTVSRSKSLSHRGFPSAKGNTHRN
jgi:hypothetical protein